MMERIKSDRIIVNEGIVSGCVYFENGRIYAVTKEDLPYETEYDETGYYVAPGFIDMHVHGGGGHEFFKSAEDIIEGSRFHMRHGTTAICPTISAAPFEVMRKSVREFKKAGESRKMIPELVGLHLEGPYLSPEQCGAQCTDFITPPVPEQYCSLMEEAGELIARWTYAPEHDPEGTFCRYLTDHHIIASAGHTNATYEHMCTAMENGCSLVTHLYSCTSTISRHHGFRKLGVIESAFLHDELYVEIIADGKHLPPELIRMILKIKGSDRVALVTDSLALAGSGITHGTTLNTEFIIEDGVCKLMDRSAFAGSIATADVLIRVLVKEVGVSVPEAVKMMTKVPAEILNLNKGILEAGRDADIVVFDDDIQIKNVFLKGRQCS